MSFGSTYRSDDASLATPELIVPMKQLTEDLASTDKVS